MSPKHCDARARLANGAKALAAGTDVAALSLDIAGISMGVKAIEDVGDPLRKRLAKALEAELADPQNALSKFDKTLDELKSTQDKLVAASDALDRGAR